MLILGLSPHGLEVDRHGNESGDASILHTVLDQLSNRLGLQRITVLPDGYTDRQTDRQTDGQTDRQILNVTLLSVTNMFIVSIYIHVHVKVSVHVHTCT